MGEEKKPNLVYAALLLHSSGKEITESAVIKIVRSCDLSIDDVQVKALVAALEGVNIDEAISKAVAMPSAGAPAAAGAPAEAAKEEESAEDKGKKAEEAAEGLGSLFG